MSSRDMAIAYVEKILRSYLGTEDLVVDKDGDIPIRRGSALYFVRVTTREPYRVEVFSSVLAGVEESLELYQAINEINANVYGIQAYYRNGRVIFGTDMLADTLQPAELENACAVISSCADDHDDKLQARFGGQKTFEDDGGEDAVDL